MIWRARYDTWAQAAGTQVLLAADVAEPGWRGQVGPVTPLLEQADFDPDLSTVMMCGPQPMMLDGARRLLQRGVADDRIWLSLERNFQCGVGHCGHCQLGPYFVCRDGPVFRYRDIRWLFGTQGF
jgi:NAD(P)H-flavin reductase